MNPPAAPRNNPAWRVIAGLLALFAMPGLVAAGLYYSAWRPAPAAAHGTLAQPPLPVGEVVVGAEGGRTISLGHFGERWMLLHFAGAECPPACRQALHAMRQVHLAVGRERGRLQRLFAARGALSPDTAAALAHDFPGTVLLSTPADGSLDGWPRAWPRAGRIFLIDPQGNLVMAWAADADPGGIRQDLARLLAYSWVG